MERSSNNLPSTTNTITTTNISITNTISDTASNFSSSSNNNNNIASSAHIHSSLKSLNKSSYKISKSFSRNTNHSPAAAAEAAATATAPVSGGGAAPLPQPPVYNIDKNDFRNVVQKLTGSTAQHQASPARPPPPPPAGHAPTSRLHRIRPPPLVPAPLVDPWMRPPQFSLLPPLPSVSAAAESPISAYMRRLHGSGSMPGLLPSPTAAPVLPSLSSPMAFGCLQSPLTAYQMMMAQGLVLPTSPGVHLPSPRLGDP